MTVKEILECWDSNFDCEYPETWVLRMWAQKYAANRFEFAAGVARRAIQSGRLASDTTDLGKYLSGVLRHSAEEDQAVEQEISAHQIESRQ